MADPPKPTGREVLKDEMSTELNHSNGDRLVETRRPLDELDVELKNLGGDCIKVMQLLKADPSLLKDCALAVLHLGVSRGCIQIVEQVVKFYKGEDSLADGSERGLEKDEQQKTKAIEYERNASNGSKGEDILGETSELSQQGVKSSREAEINGSSDKTDAPTVALVEVQIQIDDKNEHSDPDHSHCQDDSIREMALDEHQIQIDDKIENNDPDHSHSQDDSFRGTAAAGKGTSSNFVDFVDFVLDEEYGENDERPGLDFDKLLSAKYLYSGPARELDAIEVAVVNGNLDVLALLLTKTPHASPIELHRNQLREITQRVVERIRVHSVLPKICQSIFDAWRDDPEFNFLFWDIGLGQERISEYLFHFLFTNRFKHPFATRAQERYASGLRKYLWREVWDYQGEPPEEPLWKSLLTLHDAQGRTPLHVAIDEGTVWEFLSELIEPLRADQAEVFPFAMEATDGLGRTPWHRALLRPNEANSVGVLLGLHISLVFQCPDGTITEIRLWEHPMEDPVSRLRRQGLDLDWPRCDLENGLSEGRTLSKTTPLHSSLLRNPLSVDELSYEEAFSPQGTRFQCWVSEFGDCSMDALELATITGNVDAVKQILASAEQGPLKTAYTSKQSSEWGINNRYGWVVGDRKQSYDFVQLTCPTIHIAAYSGNYEMLKVFIESNICDPYIEDPFGRSILHAVLNPKKFSITADLTDFANVKHIPPNYVGPPAHEGKPAERQDCINLLLQSGCDIFKVDKDGQAPYPKGDLRQNQIFFSWWNDRQLKEFTANQNSMSFATNAISVMATLVATASYVGPLQPPLGYSSGDGPNQIQTKYIWVRIFIVCDTLSFYLAIAAITFSLIPALPMPQQAMAAELQKTRGMIILAVATLFPSIVCILLAFAAGSIVVISANGISSLGGNLTIITGSIGGVICLIGFLLLFIRLLGIMFPRVRQVRKLYDLTSFFFEGKGITFPTVVWVQRIKSILTRYWRQSFLHRSSEKYDTELW